MTQLVDQSVEHVARTGANAIEEIIRQRDLAQAVADEAHVQMHRMSALLDMTERDLAQTKARCDHYQRLSIALLAKLTAAVAGINDALVSAKDEAGRAIEIEQQHNSPDDDERLRALAERLAPERELPEGIVPTDEGDFSVAKDGDVCDVKGSIMLADLTKMVFGTVAVAPEQAEAAEKYGWQKEKLLPGGKLVRISRDQRKITSL